MYFCMNVSCERVGHGGGVLLRALEPVAGIEQMARNRELKRFPSFFRRGGREGWGTDEECGKLRELTSGPGRLCQALGITRGEDNGLDLTDPKSPLQLRDDGTRAGRVLVTARIGIRHASDLPLRFIVAGNGCVSGPKSLNGESRPPAAEPKIRTSIFTRLPSVP
jgi:DNA-3-methyladenine glycosylase